MIDFGVNQKYILNLLIKQKLISASDAEKARQISTDKSIGVIDAAIIAKIIPEDQILRTLAHDLGLKFIQLSSMSIDIKAIETITHQQAKEYHIMPVIREMNTLIIATHKPLDLEYIDNLRMILNLQVDTVVATRMDIEQTIDKYYAKVINENEVGTKETSDSLNNTETEHALLQYMDDEDKHLDHDDAPVIRLVSSIITDAFNSRASDIHIEPLEKTLRIRFRIDGVLVEIKKHPKQLQAPVTSRVKLLAGMKIAEKRMPQDGKIKLKIRNNPIDIRVSALPSTYGESVVMRILDKSELNLGLPSLGFLSDTEKIWNQLINFSNGVILITGPTGSGKTTTLYSCLHALNTSKRKIITIEDPIEYQLNGINQVQVKEEVHLSFSSVLRACLRQAPNIIMVGEIRDNETAKIAMNAAFTGHLVFSTLHTNDAPGGITRLIDQKVEPFLVASAVRGILAQRLVRKICINCKISYVASDHEIGILNLRDQKKSQTLFKGQGCKLCSGTGYKGRTGIFELLMISPDIQDMIYNKNSSAEIRELAIRNGMRTLREDGILKVLNGTTTIEELLRVTKIGET
ncbi:MAG: hypothetical protein ACD_79C00507G0004 [uncultured bacterium]|nr:MAG: hypothetical protein ACD_79C00507G0004 [uncultured bacterium]